jgi:hypothetical protein
LRSHDDQRRHRDRIEHGRVIAPVKDGRLLADEALGSRVVHHRPDDAFNACVTGAGGVHQAGPEHRVQRCETSAPGERDRLPTPFGILRPIHRRPRVEQAEPRHAIRRLPDDLERDIATHGEAGQGEALGRRIKDAGRDPFEPIGARMIRDMAGRHIRKPRDLRREQRSRTVEARYQNQIRHPFTYLACM